MCDVIKDEASSLPLLRVVLLLTVLYYYRTTTPVNTACSSTVCYSCTYCLCLESTTKGT